MFQDLKKAQKSPMSTVLLHKAWMVPDPESLPYAVLV